MTLSPKVLKNKYLLPLCLKNKATTLKKKKNKKEAVSYLS